MLHNYSPEGFSWRRAIESTIFQCAHGDSIAYPLTAIELEIQGKPVLVNAAVLDTLPQSVLVGEDILGLLEMLQTRSKY